MTPSEISELHSLQRRLENLDCKRSALSRPDRERLEHLETVYEFGQERRERVRQGAGFI